MLNSKMKQMLFLLQKLFSVPPENFSILVSFTDYEFFDSSTASYIQISGNSTKKRENK